MIRRLSPRGRVRTIVCRSPSASLPRCETRPLWKRGVLINLPWRGWFSILTVYFDLVEDRLPWIDSQLDDNTTVPRGKKTAEGELTQGIPPRPTRQVSTFQALDHPHTTRRLATVVLARARSPPASPSHRQAVFTPAQTRWVAFVSSISVP